jgi:uncharacterized protein
MTSNKWGFPDLGFGLGLRTVHYQHILRNWPEVDFFEVLAENFMSSEGRPTAILEAVSERYPIVVHGVSLSVGSTDPLDMDYLGRLKNLARSVKAQWVSDHLCWTGVVGRNTHDLLPMPLTDESLAHVISRVKMIQDFMEMPLVIENPSTYLEFKVDQWKEWDYLNTLCREADCGLLLDVNNIFVSGHNHGFDVHEYVDAIDPDRVVYHHLAGHSNHGNYIIDTHNDHVVSEVWDLYARCYQRFGARPTLVEWDADIPPFETVHAEVLKSRLYRDQAVASLV